MFWNIWIERNQIIFNDMYQNLEQILVKTQALVGDILNDSKMSKNQTKLTPDEVNWMDSFNIVELDIETVKKIVEVWELRMDQTQFDIQMKERKKFKLLFDWASKGNSRATGGGGIMSCPEGNIEIEYYWSIGNDSNNMAEASCLW